MSVASFVSHALINITDPGFALQVPPPPRTTARRDKDYKKMNGVLEKPTVLPISRFITSTPGFLFLLSRLFSPGLWLLFIADDAAISAQVRNHFRSRPPEKPRIPKGKTKEV